MKRIFIVILAFLYLGLASGVVMNLHYCMGQLSSIEYGYHKHDRCGKCGMAEKEGCCDTELKVVKLQDSHQWAKSVSLFKQVISVSSYNPDQYTLLIPRSYQPYIAGYHSPPDRRDNQVYLHKGVLLI